MAPATFRKIVPVLAVWMSVSIAAPASAQYFGRNKVQYKKLDFQVMKTEHFDIYFYPEEREGIDIAARMAERWHARLERLLAHQLRGRQPLVLYASHPDFEQTNAIQGELGEGTGGVTEGLRRRIVLPLGGPLADTDHVIGHELVHAFQFDITTGPNSPPGQNGAERLPLWFIEGMAEYLSIGPIDPNTAMWLRDAARPLEGKEKDGLPSIKDLNNPKYFPYRWGQAFWAYVAGRFGDDVVRRMLSVGAASGDPDVAIEKVLGLTAKELSADWQSSIRQTYAPAAASAAMPSELGRLVIEGKGLGADLNVGPAISPDARWIAFLSTRSVFSTDLFIADAATGKIVHKLTSTATDPHFSSIQFIYSAGAWDAASQRIAIATVASGRPALAIFEAASGTKQREVSIPELDEIFNPTWAPDGHAICFTGMTRGLTDLFIYDLSASKLRRLTNDPYADLQPAWSPDGRRIAFATDRFSSDLRTLDIGHYRLATIDPDSGVVESLRAFTSGKNINPQWTPDGRALLFISDRDGTSNLYRIALDSGDVTQMTRVATGVSGITASSPAMSVASKTGVGAFSVYQGGKYDIYVTEGTGGSGRPGGSGGPGRVGGAGGSDTLSEPTQHAGALPPLDRGQSEVLALLNNATFGLPAPTTYDVTDYTPSLSLESVAQPTIAVGASRFGAAVGGGIAFQFGDMLGDHQLATVVQLTSGLTNNFSAKNTAAQVMYFNQAHRWSWGVVGGQIPYLSGGFESAVGTLGGEPVEVDRSIIFRQTEQSAAGIIAYPFNRAQRVEFQGGVTRISFDQIVETSAFSLRTGELIANDSSETSLAAPLSLATTSAALVFDTANYGATSPVQGQRYRFEASPTFGGVNFTSMLADYRRYFMPVSFYTIAVRALHYGRYGSGGEDTRLFPLFLGYPNLVRGYDVGSFQAGECIPTAASECPAFDRLVGSRVLVGNLELRFPLLRPFGASQRMYGPIPVEMALFADGGVAWSRGDKPSFLGGDKQGVGSAGVAFRVNVLGFAVAQFDFARPFQRPGRGWVFQFNLSPGF
jgi:Tol biopolymer transport system component